MNINERINSSIQDIQNIKEQGILRVQKEGKEVKQIANDLKLEEFLEEIKTNVWGTGEVSMQESGSYKDLSISLTARWPKFKPKHLTTLPNGDDYYVNPSIKLTGPSINIELGFGTYEAGVLTTIKLDEETSDFKYYNNPETVFSKFSAFNIKDYKNEIEETILKFCVEEKLKGRYPLTLEIQKDRQEIIQKINSGELLMENVPNGFFKEDEMKFVNPPKIKTETPQKRSFLDKLIGK